MYSIHYAVYNENVNKSQVQKEWDSHVSTSSYDKTHGLLKDIKWIDEIFDNEKDAREYIEKIDAHDCDQLAVKFLDYSNIKDFKTKGMQEIERRIKETKEKYRKSMAENHYVDIKSNLIGCKTCGSKINREYIKDNACPACGDDMRPPTILNRLEALEAKWTELEAKYAELEARQLIRLKNKASVKWLVKVEYEN